MADLSARLASLASSVEQYEGVVANAREELRTYYGKQGQSLARKISNAKSTFGIDNLSSSIKSIARSLEALQQEARDLRSDLRETKAQLQRTEAQNTKLKNDKDDLKRKAEKLSVEKDVLKQQLRDAGSDNVDFERVKAKHDALKRENRQLSDDKKRLDREKEQLQQSKQKLEHDVQNYRLERVNLQQRNEALQYWVDVYGPKSIKPKCRGCQKKIYHLCDEFGAGRWVRFDTKT